MQIPRRALVLLASALSIDSVPRAAQQADTELIAEARQVLTYLSGSHGGRTLSGMSSYGGWRTVYEACGYAPAIYSNDAFGWNPPKWGPSYRRVMQDAIDSTRDWWEDKGGIPAMQFHWGKPGQSDGTAWVENTGPVDMARTVTPGTAEYDAMMRDLRLTADYLEQLSNAHVPVLWRPLHEIDGGWFWWTDRQTPENTAQLWRIMFDYFVRERNLHNLIWVYSAGVRAGGLPRPSTLQQEILFRARYYPGTDYVDLAGIDIYPNAGQGYGQPRDDTYRKAFTIMQGVAPGKALALCETQALVSPELLATQGPQWLYCLPWFFDGRNPANWVRVTFPHDQYVSLDELPALLPGGVRPDVRLVLPTDGCSTSGDSLQLVAAAGDRDGDLASVEFYALPGPWRNWFLRDEPAISTGARKLADGRQDADQRWVATWLDVPTGLHQVVAVATDRSGRRTLSNVGRCATGSPDFARSAAISASSRPEQAALAIDADLFTAWTGEREVDQWLRLDLLSSRRVGTVVTTFDQADAEAYRVETSIDGNDWKTVATRANRRSQYGDTDLIRFSPVDARFVRLVFTEPGTSWGGFDVFGISVFGPLPD